MTTFLPDTAFGKYRIIRLLGQGGMADVYEAEDTSIGRRVALKILPLAFARDEERARRFAKEIQASAALDHPNIVSVFEVGEADGLHYYTMSVLPGGDLKDRLRNGALDQAEAVRITREIASALHYAHEKGFVHRDVKPENILFREDGSAVLTDFGIAKATVGGTRMTATGLSIGTPHYMSPEQARGMEVDGRSDLYALGVVFYEMLKGRVPFDATDSLAIGIMHLQQPVPGFPEHLKEYQPILDRLLAKEPAERYPNGEALARTLEAVESEAALSGQATRLTPRTPSSTSQSAKGSKEPEQEGDTPSTHATRLIRQAHRSAPKHAASRQATGPSSRTGKPGSAVVWAFGGVLAAVVLAGGLYWMQVAKEMRLDQAAWDRALLASTVESYQRYVDDFSDGRFTKQARDRIRRIELAERERQAEEKRREQIAWGKAVEQSTETAYQQYLKDYPAGQYVDAARERMSELRQLRQRQAQATFSNSVTESGDVFQDCPDCPEMVVIPAGSFMMGSPSSESQRDSDEGPQHRVTLQSFALGKTEVTFAQWQACVADGGCNHRPDDENWGRGNRPVINVSWNDAQEYVDWLSRKTGEDYRLPSESEWEYAARAGTTTRFHTGNCITTDQANFDGNYPPSGCSKGQYRKRTVPVGSFAANAFGLHDMHGNVWEWVQDCWNGSYRGAPADGSAWMRGDCGRALLRGGSWLSDGQTLRSANRLHWTRGSRRSYGGFRLARSVTL